MAADREPQTRAAVLSRAAAVHLTKFLENQFERFLRNTDSGVGDGDRHLPVLGSVNLIALLRRLMMICFNFSWSVRSGGRSAPTAFSSRSRSLLIVGSTV